ncbi:MAG: N-acetyltransferase [Bacteroidales bacterium]|nr:N-acetyltransferase [Bacteroidales bacterium]MBR4524278.1 N-acetyltransferase [Bacteroidales bacterium]
MSVEIKEVTTRRELRVFVNFPEKLYKDNPYYVPPLVFDQMDTLDQKKGAAQEFCDSKLYLAYKDGELVGRVAAIVNHKANAQWNHKQVRFGWIDFIDDREVSHALMDKVVEFGRQHGMDSIVGPLGFTDFDPEGMLVDGYDQISTMALIYNHPYYVTHIEEMGFEKDADWLEYRMFFDGTLPERYDRLHDIVLKRAGCHVREINRKMIREENYGMKVFECINKCYKDLYNFTVLPTHMAEKYLGFYLSILDLQYLCMIENEKGELVAFGITMPSICKALQKTRGKLFPFGWFHILKSLMWKNEGGAELLLVGVIPEYQKTGINSVLVLDVLKNYHKNGIKWAETNAILESNNVCKSQFEVFPLEYRKRRRSYIRKLEV